MLRLKKKLRKSKPVLEELIDMVELDAQNLVKGVKYFIENPREKKMKSLKFYDVRAKHSVTTDKYKQMTSKGRKFAVATASDGTKMYRILPKAK